MPPVPSTAIFEGFVAVLTALPAFNSLLKDWTLLLPKTFSPAFGWLLNRVKMTPVPLFSFSSTRLCGSCQWELGHIGCRGLFHQGVLLALDVVKLLIPLTSCKVDQVEKAVLSRLLIDRHHRT